MNETESIVKKVQALLKKTTDNGATADEMETALNFAQKLMEKYSLSFEDLKEEDVEVTSSELIDIETKNSIEFIFMAKSVANLFHCDILSVQHRKMFERRARRGFKIIGETQHREFVEFLLAEIFVNVVSSFNNLKKQGLIDRTNTLREKYSFERGYFNAVLVKAEDLIKQRKKEFEEIKAQANSTGTSLMIIDSAVKNYMSKYDSVSLKTGYRNHSSDSYEKGYKQGQAQSLDKRVGRNQLLLTSTTLS